MGAFGLVQPQHAGDGVEHRVRHGRGASLFEAHVVVHAHAGQQRQFLAAQAGDAPSTTAGQAHVVGPDARPAAAEEFAEVVVHLSSMAAIGVRSLGTDSPRERRSTG
ncbi:hypothetical protein A6A25_10585 [Saccharothrix sp. CB00851]|nr:hypothetical protein A6A25_10585 [Saccharothrix sp. CB00851]